MVSKWVATPSLDSFFKRYTQLQCIIQCTMQIPMRYVLINSQHWDTSLLFVYFHKHLKRNLRSKIKFSDRFECVWSSSGSFKEDSWRLHNCLTWAVECLTQLGMSFFFFLVGWYHCFNTTVYTHDLWFPAPLARGLLLTLVTGEGNTPIIKNVVNIVFWVTLCANTTCFMR